MATGTIKNTLAWRDVDSVTGTTEINLPSGFIELQIEVQYGTNNLYFPFHIISKELKSQAKTFTLGYYINSTSYGLCQVQVTTSKASCISLYINGTNYTSTAQTRVFAR